MLLLVLLKLSTNMQICAIKKDLKSEKLHTSN